MGSQIQKNNTVNQSGVAVVEYMVLAALFAVVLLMALPATGINIAETFGKISGATPCELPKAGKI